MPQKIYIVVDCTEPDPTKAVISGHDSPTQANEDLGIQKAFGPVVLVEETIKSNLSEATDLPTVEVKNQ